jgi:hypothetical protein
VTDETKKTEEENAQRPTPNAQFRTGKAKAGTKKKTIATVLTPLPPGKAKRIARKLERAMRLGGKIGELCQRREELYGEALAAGLPMNGVIRLSDGKLYTVQKPTGKFVRFNELELKTVPTFKQAPKADEEPAAATKGGAE